MEKPDLLKSVKFSFARIKAHEDATLNAKRRTDEKSHD